MGSLGGGAGRRRSPSARAGTGPGGRRSGWPPASWSARWSSGWSSAASPTRPAWCSPSPPSAWPSCSAASPSTCPTGSASPTCIPTVDDARSPTHLHRRPRRPSPATTCCCWPSCRSCWSALTLVPAAHRRRHGGAGHGREHRPGPAARHPGQPAVAAAVDGRRRAGRPDRRAAGPERGRPAHRAAGPTVLLPGAGRRGGRRAWGRMPGAFVAGVRSASSTSSCCWNVDNAAPTSVVLLVVILVALLLQRRSGHRAEAAGESSWSVVGVGHGLPRAYAALPEVRRPRSCWAARGRWQCWPCPLLGTDSQINFGTLTLAYGLVALSLVVLTGWGGVVSLGQVAIMGVGGVVTANLIADHNIDLFCRLVLSGAGRRRRRARHRPAGAAGVGPVPGRHHAGLRRGHGALLPQPGQLRGR